MTTAPLDAHALVTQQLALAGIVASAEEVAAMVAAAPARAAEAERLYAVAGARYEEPCLVFDALPPA